MPVSPTPFGHVGVFPEQASNWRWLAATKVVMDAPSWALNLFAYTGASTMALAKAGFAVAHVDAAKPNVQSARQAAEINDLVDHPIRYLVDDAARFVSRELRRERAYHTIVLDPPAYGHGPSGKAWRLERDLWPLLEDCCRLLTKESFRLLVTGHSPQVDSGDVVQFLKESNRLPTSAGLRFQSGRSQLSTTDGRALDAGFYVRVFCET